MKKHGFIWWICIGWWWVPITLPFRLIVALCKRQAKPSKAASPSANSAETHKVAGASYRQEAFLKLAIPNANYSKTKRELQQAGLTDKWVYEYGFSPAQVQLVPEPENPHDRNAIKVVVDGEHLGYIKAGSCAHVHKLLREGRIQRITCKIGGGRSKMLCQDEEGRFYFEQDDIPFYARLSITTKPEK